MTPNIEGADAMMIWFGFWPTLHDSRIEEIRLLCDGTCLVRIAAKQMLAETDANGQYRVGKQCVVSFYFKDVDELRLTSDSPIGTIIFEMEWQEPDGAVLRLRHDRLSHHAGCGAFTVARRVERLAGNALAWNRMRTARVLSLQPQTKSCEKNNGTV